MIVTSAVGKLVDVDVCLRKPVDYDEFLGAVPHGNGAARLGRKRWHLGLS